MEDISPRGSTELTGSAKLAGDAAAPGAADSGDFDDFGDFGDYGSQDTEAAGTARRPEGERPDDGGGPPNEAVVSQQLWLQRTMESVSPTRPQCAAEPAHLDQPAVKPGASALAARAEAAPLGSTACAVPPAPTPQRPKSEEAPAPEAAPLAWPASELALEEDSMLETLEPTPRSIIRQIAHPEGAPPRDAPQVPPQVPGGVETSSWAFSETSSAVSIGSR